MTAAQEPSSHIMHLLDTMVDLACLPNKQFEKAKHELLSCDCSEGSIVLQTVATDLDHADARYLVQC